MLGDPGGGRAGGDPEARERSAACFRYPPPGTAARRGSPGAAIGYRPWPRGSWPTVCSPARSRISTVRSLIVTADPVFCLRRQRERPEDLAAALDRRQGLFDAGGRPGRAGAVPTGSRDRLGKSKGRKGTWRFTAPDLGGPLPVPRVDGGRQHSPLELPPPAAARRPAARGRGEFGRAG